MNSSSIISQQLLEQNEDIIAAVVENLQLGRLDDCIKHYSILQSNLVAFALELDNFPGNSDAYEALPGFPDEIMRKDILEDLQPHGTRALPEPPLIPPCVNCIENGQYSSEVCRLQLKHVDPSSKFSFLEREEFLQATQVIASRNRLGGGHDANSKGKRLYKIWNSYEKYSMLLAVAEYGSRNFQQIAGIMETRSENQIRSYIQKHLRDDSQIPRKQDILRKVPKGYHPPPGLAHLFTPSVAAAVATSGTENDDVTGLQLPQQHPQVQQSPRYTPSTSAAAAAAAAASSSSSSLAPQQGRNDWSSLLSMAAGVIVPSVHVTSSGQIHHTFPSPIATTTAAAGAGGNVFQNTIVPSVGTSSLIGGGSLRRIQDRPIGISAAPSAPPPHPHMRPALHLPSLSANITVASLPPPPLEAPTTLADPLKEIVAETKRLEEEARRRSYYATYLTSDVDGKGSVSTKRANNGAAKGFLDARGSGGGELDGNYGFSGNMPPPTQKRRIEPPPFAKPGIAKLKMQQRIERERHQQHQQFNGNYAGVFNGGGGMDYGMPYQLNPYQPMAPPFFNGGVVNPAVGSLYVASSSSSSGSSSMGSGGVLGGYSQDSLEPHSVGNAASGESVAPGKKDPKAKANTAKRPNKGRKGASGSLESSSSGGTAGDTSAAATAADKPQSEAQSARYNFDLSDLCSSPNKEVMMMQNRAKVRRYNAVDATVSGSGSGSAAAATTTTTGVAGSRGGGSGGVSLFSAATNQTTNKRRPPLPPNAATAAVPSVSHANVPVDEVSLHGQDSSLLLEIDDNYSLFN